jgi:hypothetical protein
VGLRAGLDETEKRKFLTLPGLELRPFGRPARSQSLYRLRYPVESELIIRRGQKLSRDCTACDRNLILMLKGLHLSEVLM